MPTKRETPEIPAATVAVIQGMKNAGRGRSRFESWLSNRAAEHAQTRLQAMREELQLILEYVAENGPNWTGASAGRTNAGSIPVPKWHPAYGLSLGNERGESGWQIAETARRNGSQVSMSLVNPMWNPYLKIVEAGAAPASVHSRGGFVRDAWGHHLQRRRI